MSHFSLIQLNDWKARWKVTGQRYSDFWFTYLISFSAIFQTIYLSSQHHEVFFWILLRLSIQATRLFACTFWRVFEIRCDWYNWRFFQFGQRFEHSYETMQQLKVLLKTLDLWPFAIQWLFRTWFRRNTKVLHLFVNEKLSLKSFSVQKCWNFIFLTTFGHHGTNRL